MNQASECASFDWSFAPKFRASISCLRWKFVLILFAWKWQSYQLFFYRHRMGHWIYYRIRAEQGPQTKFVVGTPNGMGFALQLRQFSLPSRLQVLRCEFFELLSAIGSTLSKHHNPIVRFRLPSHSAVSLCVRGIRCEWRTTKWINYWASRSTSSSALAMEISSSASIQKF